MHVIFLPIIVQILRADSICVDKLWYTKKTCVLASHAALRTCCGPFFWQCSLPLPSSFSLQQSSLKAQTRKSMNSCIIHARRCQRTSLCMAPQARQDDVYFCLWFPRHCHKHMSQCLQLYWSSPTPWIPMTTERQSQQAMLTITSMKISNALCVGRTSYVIP